MPPRFEQLLCSKVMRFRVWLRASERNRAFASCLTGVAEPESKRERSSGAVYALPFDRAALWAYTRVLVRVMPSAVLIKRFGSGKSLAEDDGLDRRDVRIATIYVLAVTVLLIAALLVGRSAQPWRTIIVALVSWRLLEIFTVGLGIVLRRRGPLFGRSVVAVGFLALQVTLVFALLDQSLAHGGFAAGHARPVSPLQFLYVSWTEMTTLGGSYGPTSDTARGLEMATGTAGILVLAILVQTAVQYAINPESARPDESPEG